MSAPGRDDRPKRGRSLGSPNLDEIPLAYEPIDVGRVSREEAERKRALAFAEMRDRERRRAGGPRPLGRLALAAITTTKGTRPDMRTYVKLYKDGDRMAVETNAETEEQFHSAFCAELSEVLPDFGGDAEFQLGYWLKNYVDICCKLRGYKADVHETRVITAGFLPPGDALRVVPSTEPDAKGP